MSASLLLDPSETSLARDRRMVWRKDEPARSRVLVIGAGPAGLATAASLRKEGVAFDLVDRTGKPAGAYAYLDGGISLSSPAHFTQLPGMELVSATPYITIATYRDYLERYAERFDLGPEKGSVERIDRRGEKFEVKLADETRTRIYDAAVAATGMCEDPVWPTIEGLPRPAKGSRQFEFAGSPRVMHSREWPGARELLGKRILIVGGASSAVAIAEQCAAAGMRVVVGSRGNQVRFSLARIFGWDLRRWTYPIARRLPRAWFGRRCGLRPSFPGTEKGFRSFRRAGLIETRGLPARFEGNVAIFEDGRRQVFDVVVLATGYRFAMPFLPNEVARAPAGQPMADDGQCKTWPGLFFVGIPCCRTVSSEFLHGMAADAPVVARRIHARLARRAI